jgi:hypothetical protein
VAGVKRVEGTRKYEPGHDVGNVNSAIGPDAGGSRLSGEKRTQYVVVGHVLGIGNIVATQPGA